MNWRQLPIIPTIVVLAAVATMIALGIWQLGRADEKAALIAKYEAGASNSELVKFPSAGTGADVLYRQGQVDCETVLSRKSVAGTNASGQKGWAHKVYCTTEKSDAAWEVDLGWSRDSHSPDWSGGLVRGIIAPGPRLVAFPAQAGLQPLAKPDPRDLPNNHLAYAGQWFFFALTALVIYFLAIRKKLVERRED